MKFNQPLKSELVIQVYYQLRNQLYDQLDNNELYQIITT